MTLNEFLEGLYVELAGMVVELVLVTIILAKLLAWRENKQWRPARLNVVKQLIDVHFILFNVTRCIIDPDFRPEKASRSWIAK